MKKKPKKNPKVAFVHECATHIMHSVLQFCLFCFFFLFFFVFVFFFFFIAE